MSKHLNPQVRADDGGDVDAGAACPSAGAAAGRTPQLRAEVPRLHHLHDRRDAAVNVGEIDYDALMRQLKSASATTTARRCRTRWRTRAATPRGNGARRAASRCSTTCNLELNEGPTDFDNRHNFVVSGRRSSRDRRPERQLGGARAERPPFTLTNASSIPTSTAASPSRCPPAPTPAPAPTPTR